MRRFTAEEGQAQKRQINELYERFYHGESEIPGEPAKYDPTPAGVQGNMFDVQAQAPKKAISSTVPMKRQIEGTMFEQPGPADPPFSMSGRNDRAVQSNDKEWPPSW